MKRIRRSVVKKYVESSDSEDDRPLKKSSPAIEENVSSGDSSSSESDIENYLHKPEKLDLNSEFFNSRPSVGEFEDIEKNIFAGVTRLSDSESASDKDLDTNHKLLSPQDKLDNSLKKEQNETSSKLSFNNLQDYTKKIEEAKKQVEIYKAKKKAQENKIDISNLLAAGERKAGIEHTITLADLHSSDFESCDSEQDDWEEIKVKAPKEKDENLIPAKAIQITVDLPGNVKKKKGVDLLAAMKRRLNRIRKENQVLVHKVHLLGWVAHGNYVNSAINDTQTMAMALSLLPSEQCYPPDRTDLSYLEQIVTWYKRTVKNLEKAVPEDMPLTTCLQYQINRKEAYNKKMLAIIFVAILRALGIQARIVMSLQVEPLRPPANELHSLSVKENKSSQMVNKSSKDKKVISGQQQIQSKISSQPATNIKVNTPGKSNSLNSQKNALETSAAVKPEIKVNIEVPTPDKKIKNVTKNGTLTCDDKTKNSRPRKNISSPKSEKREKSRKDSIKNEAKAKLKVAEPRGRSKSLEIEDSEQQIGEQKNKNKKGKNSQNTEKGPSQNKHIVKTSDSKTHLPPNQPKIPKRAKSTESIDSLQRTRRRQETENSSLLKPEDHRERKRTKSTESLDSLQSNSSRRSTRSMTGGGSKHVSEPNLAGASTRNLKKSTKTKTSSDGNSTSRSKSSENSKARSKKVISQVDGIYDSESSDVENPILQLDGTNDKQESKQKRKPNLKTLKNTSKAKKDVKTRPNLKSLSAKNGPKKILPKKEVDSDSDSEFEPPNGSPFKKRLEKAASDLRKLNNIKHQSSKQLDVKKIVVNLVKRRISEQKRIERSRMVRKRKPDPDSDTDDSYYVLEPIKKKHHDSETDFVPKVKVKRRVQVHPVLSDSDSEKKKKKGNDVWVEVFLEAEEKWITADVVRGQVHCIKEIAARASHPISYIVAWDNNNFLKDVTQRYCPNFNTIIRKLRVDPKWWSDSLKPFMGIPTARDKEEDDDLARLQLDQPLPKSIAEYKDHPLYALRRHLLKFQAIYPPEPPTLGFIRGEAVYPRSCVYTLHSRDIWLKQAKVVKLGEQPYKIVKARPKWDKLSNRAITDQLLEIFGPWQVQDYEPPTAENGIVPKNAFGNVDLFKPCMLPKGCVHLDLPGLNKLARKMNIDCASAIIGFDFHGGWSHPVYDGFVVCKEYEDQLICAWELEKDELDRKEQEKVKKRVYGNWKKLIRGLLIRERLKAKYDFGGPSTSTAKDQKKNKAPTFCTKKR